MWVAYTALTGQRDDSCPRFDGTRRREISSCYPEQCAIVVDCG